MTAMAAYRHCLRDDVLLLCTLQIAFIREKHIKKIKTREYLIKAI